LAFCGVLQSKHGKPLLPLFAVSYVIVAVIMTIRYIIGTDIFKNFCFQITLMGFMMLLLSALLGYVSGTRVHQFSNASHYLSFCQMI
jgi:uncharacterized MAPEG superfamily protein